MEKLYAIYADEGDKERLIWVALEKSKTNTREYFYGGSGIVPCIHTNPQSAHSQVRKARKDFKEGTQFYVRKVSIINNPGESQKRI